MDDPLGGISRFFRELKRRSVYRVAAMYAVVGFVVIEAADLIFPALNIPSWAYSLVVVLALLGFPVALVLAWAFEMTPEGVRRTPELEEEASGDGEATAKPSPAGSGVAVRALVGLGFLAAAAAGVWYLTGGGGETEPRAGERSIAVLPFENMGGEESEQFTRGVHDGLLTRLSNISGMEVISRTSVMQFEETRLPLPAIAESLGVKWVMEGGVQKMGDQLQVNAQLIDPRTDTHAWAEQYRRDLTATDLFAIQSEITKKIAGSLEARLTPEEQRRVERRPTEDLEAYRLYVRGRAHLDRRSEEGMHRALDYFRRAIEVDSTYALAWSGLADARSLLVSYGHASSDTLVPRALEAARRAVELDPDLGEAHASLGHLEFGHRSNGPEAVRELERAVELDPMSPSIHGALSLAYRYGGRLPEALEAACRAEELAPDVPSAIVIAGMTLLDMERHAEAIARFRRVVERTDPSPLVATENRAWLAIAHHRAGHTARADELLVRIRERKEYPFQEGMVHAALGDRDAAMEALREARYDFFRTSYLRYEPVFDPLRSDPAFRKLLRGINRQWGLNPDGNLPEDADPGA